jgi:hypothetical protein
MSHSSWYLQSQYWVEQIEMFASVLSAVAEADFLGHDSSVLVTEYCVLARSSVKRSLIRPRLIA